MFAEGIIRVGGSGGMTAGFTRPSETGRTSLCRVGLTSVNTPAVRGCQCHI